MAQKAIREYHAKKLISKFIPEFYPDFEWKAEGILIEKNNLTKSILDTLESIPTTDKKLVVKPDQLFGKRGKNGLIHIAKDDKDAAKWIKSKIGKKTTVVKNDKDKGIEGELTHFLIEPFVEHDNEYFVAIKTDKEHDVIYFSKEGGIEVEENWDKVTEIKIPFKLKNESVSHLVSKSVGQLVSGSVSSDVKGQMSIVTSFVSALYQVFKKLNFAYLEINPFSIVGEKIELLDTVARLDTTALYDMGELWNVDGKIIEFPKPFGSNISEIEKKIEDMDEKSGASFKLTMLNPNGRLWLLIGGGGPSVVYPDTIADMGKIDEIGNYGEYSGGATTEETEIYCDHLFSAMFKSKAKNKVLLAGGGIANFTDIKKTYLGITNAIKKHQKEFLKQGIKVYGRRGGPNFVEGLKYTQEEIEKLGIPVEMYGPEYPMTHIIRLALESK